MMSVTGDFTGNADMPFDFFMSRYKEAYLRETEAFCKVSSCLGGLVNHLVLSLIAWRHGYTTPPP